MHPSDKRHALRELLEPTVQRLGFDLVAVELTTGRKRPLVRVSIDKVGGRGGR